MRLDDNVSLVDCNTLRLPARARYFGRIASLDDLREGLSFCNLRSLPLLILGGGSNVVLRERFEGCVLRMEMQGEELLQLTDEYVDIRVAAGLDWHALVLSCHAGGWHGLENLALIPGTVGAAPIQNIGAYGVEVREFIRAVKVLDRRSGESFDIANAECGFAYRQSRFQRERSLIITAVSLRLPLNPTPNTAYAALREELSNIAVPTHADVLRAVIAIRRRKLPDPAQLPNAGSFFKNPVIDAARFAELKQRFPAIVHWPQGEGVKLAAAWLVDQCGWRGKREGDAGVHEHQVLVLVNHGSARAEDLLRLAARIAESVRDYFGVELEIEPQIF